MHSHAQSESAARSYLYVPGDQKERLDGASARGADALILDLEDSVSLQNKTLARERVAAWLADNGETTGQVWVRTTSTSPAADIAALTSRVTGVMVPKAEPELLRAVDELLTSRERELQAVHGSFAIIALIETARGLLSAAELASLPRVARLAIGRADLAGELGLRLEPEDAGLDPLLLQLVIASAAAGIASPMAPTSTDFRDLVALRESTERLLRLGFRGRSAIHPAQLATINEVFTPSEAEVQRASRLVAAFEESERGGAGVMTDDDGRMVDVAVVRSAREVLARAGARQGS
ncbi:MAG: CoA ester lyase [Lacisediminihabitans sp.]